MNTTRKQIGAKLFFLALAWSKDAPPTTKARRDAIKTCRGRKQTVNGSKSIDSALAAVEAAANSIRATRAHRRQLSQIKKLKYTPVSYDYKGAKINWHRVPLHGKPAPRKKLFDGAISTRLKQFKIEKFNAARTRYRLDSSPKIELTNDPADVGVYQSDYLDWDYYSKSTKYPKKVVNTTIKIPIAWGTRVNKLGLAVVDGLTTLDAQKLEGAPEGVAAYAAKWVVQGRGYALEDVSGFIAVCGQVHYHAPSFEKAVAGAMRKAKLSASKNIFENLLTKHGVESIAARCPEIVVTVDDAKQVGACDYGIRSWCATVGIDYEIGKAPLKTVYDAYLMRPMPEARAAILHALRRHKKAVLNVA